ncbi:GntR family transcriptional regulator, partial [Rhizobium ruizarguesonis]
MRNQAPNLSKRGAAIFNGGVVRSMLTPRPFTHGIPETRTFPIQLWERLERHVFKDYGTKALLHGDPQGAEPLRRTIAFKVNIVRD